MENQNEYDDEQFTRWSVEVNAAIGGMWEAGASLSDIEEVVRNAFENVGAEGVEVSFT